MAALFCREISGEDEGRCIPPQWKRTTPTHAAPDGVVTTAR